MELLPLGRGRWGLRTPFNHRLVEELKTIPGMCWDPNARVWAGYADALAEIQEPSVGKPVSAEVLRSTSWPFAIPDIPLRNYQVAGVDFLYHRAAAGCILADIMGAGKSIQTIAAFRALGGRSVVVCPSYVRGVWQRELKKWWPEARVETLDGVKGLWKLDADPLDVVICHYDILHAWADELLEWAPQTIVFDEIQFLAGQKSRRTKTAAALAAKVPNRIGLTGTPITNRPKDLWSLVEVISPGRFGSFFKFALTFCGAEQKTVGRGADAKTVWDFSGRSNLETLKRRLSHFLLRRTHADINLELPALTRQVVELKVASKYKLPVDRKVSAKAMRHALDLAADGRLKEMAVLVRQHVEDGHKVVVFCHRRKAAETIAFDIAQPKEVLVDCLHGESSLKRRKDTIDGFAEWEGPSLLTCTYGACGVGVDLSFADVVVFAELDWVPGVMEQAEARVYRFGATKPVLAQYCIALGTAEEIIRDGLIDKMKRTMDPLVAPGTDLAEVLKGTLSDEDAIRQLWESL